MAEKEVAEEICGATWESPQWRATLGMTRREYRNYLEGILGWTRTQSDWCWPPAETTYA